MTPLIDENYRFLGARYLRRQAKRLAAQIDGARRADDPECVHQARVASRRLQAAMRMFGECFDAQQLKRWRKQIGRVTEQFGEARDKDVQIEFLCGVLEGLDERACYPGIARLMVQLEQERERLQGKVVKAAARLEAGGVLDEIRGVTKPVVAEAKARELGLQSPFALDQTRRHILDKLDELLSFRGSLADPEDCARHHAMRIAAKRLRYTLEIAAPVYDGRLDETIDATKRLQTLLGEVHDCDVWVEDLDKFAAKQGKRILKHFGHTGPLARLEVGIDHLRTQQRRRRQQVFQELVDYWQKLDRGHPWAKLLGTVRGTGRQRVGPEPPPEAASGTTAGGKQRLNDSNGPGEQLGSHCSPTEPVR